MSTKNNPWSKAMGPLKWRGNGSYAEGSWPVLCYFGFSQERKYSTVSTIEVRSSAVPLEDVVRPLNKRTVTRD